MNDIATPNFSEMEIGKLRQYASHLRVAVPKTATKDEIIELINKKIGSRASAIIADDSTDVPPGHAKIRLLEDPMPGASNYPVYLNCNGYECTIPRGKEVIVPMRVVRTLRDAKVNRRRQAIVADAQGREQFKETTVTVPSYPFDVIEMTPGPEPLTKLEQAKLRTIGPRKRYAEKFGYWPRPGQLHRAIAQGLIDVKDGEELQKAEEAALERAANGD